MVSGNTIHRIAVVRLTAIEIQRTALVEAREVTRWLTGNGLRSETSAGKVETCGVTTAWAIVAGLEIAVVSATEVGLVIVAAWVIAVALETVAALVIVVTAVAWAIAAAWVIAAVLATEVAPATEAIVPA